MCSGRATGPRSGSTSARRRSRPRRALAGTDDSTRHVLTHLAPLAQLSHSVIAVADPATFVAIDAIGSAHAALHNGSRSSPRIHKLQGRPLRRPFSLEPGSPCPGYAVRSLHSGSIGVADLDGLPERHRCSRTAVFIDDLDVAAQIKVAAANLLDDDRARRPDRLSARCSNIGHILPRAVMKPAVAIGDLEVVACHNSATVA